jgi:mono/diheme cytochrome c family protein
VVGGLLLFTGAMLYFRYNPDRPVTYDDIEEHFKYGSIGSDIENGLPLRVLQALPRMFPEYLPAGKAKDYTAFGFVQEPDRQMPIGFSTRRRFIDLTGLNCATCHTGVVRETANSQPQIVLGMQSNTLDLQGFFDFLFRCAADPRFTEERILAEMERDGPLLPPDRILYRFAVARLQAGLLLRKTQLDRFITPDHPRFGPGRVDTFNFYKTNQFAEHYPEPLIAAEERFGTAKFPSIWNQKLREGMNLHWDGNNTSVQERNLSAAFGAGATCTNVDGPSLARIKAWIDELKAPAYPFPTSNDQQQLQRGKAVYNTYCADCHASGGRYVGQVEPLESIRTDENRLNSHTEKLVSLQIGYCQGTPWEFKHFKKTDGYANAPLDGVWARAPYLHNGSAPTLWDLLLPEDQRSQQPFYTGHGVYDTEKLGFRRDVPEVDGRPSFLYDPTLRGNSNKGHSGERYGTELSDDDKRALIEYLKGY